MADHFKVPTMSMTHMLMLLAFVLFIVFYFSYVMRREGKRELLSDYEASPSLY
jgi:hypothetical protein